MAGLFPIPTQPFDISGLARVHGHSYDGGPRIYRDPTLRTPVLGGGTSKWLEAALASMNSSMSSSEETTFGDDNPSLPYDFPTMRGLDVNFPEINIDYPVPPAETPIRATGLNATFSFNSINPVNNYQGNQTFQTFNNHNDDPLTDEEIQEAAASASGDAAKKLFVIRAHFDDTGTGTDYTTWTIDSTDLRPYSLWWTYRMDEDETEIGTDPDLEVAFDEVSGTDAYGAGPDAGNALFAVTHDNVKWVLQLDSGDGYKLKLSAKIDTGPAPGASYLWCWLEARGPATAGADYEAGTET